jgi:hypothetical protein
MAKMGWKSVIVDDMRPTRKGKEDPRPNRAEYNKFPDIATRIDPRWPCAGMTDFQPIFAITPGVQSYEWGKRGSDSLTAQLVRVCVDGFEVDEDKTYAEGMGGYHGCPSIAEEESISGCPHENQSQRFPKP